MNRPSFAVSLALVLIVCAATPMVAGAQDPAKVAPDLYKVVFENARVRVMEVTMTPGAKAATHSHPDHFAYGLSTGKAKFTHADGKSIEVEIKSGDVVWVPAESHTSENIGETELKVLVVELKEPARKAMPTHKPAAKLG